MRCARRMPLFFRRCSGACTRACCVAVRCLRSLDTDQLSRSVRIAHVSGIPLAPLAIEIEPNNALAPVVRAYRRAQARKTCGGDRNLCVCTRTSCDAARRLQRTIEEQAAARTRRVTGCSLGSARDVWRALTSSTMSDALASATGSRPAAIGCRIALANGTFTRSGVGTRRERITA
jgi:hypothetical protein